MSVFGVSVRFHPLFHFIAFVSVWTGYFVELATLFVIVVIHEAGHALAASAFGWKVKAVRLLPVGGVAEVDMPGSAPAWQEAVVAAAGPLLNVLMIGIALGLRAAGLADSGWTAAFVDANLIMLGFNMLPIVPLDGGKLLLCLAGIWIPWYRTIVLTTAVGVSFSALLVAGAFFPWHSQGFQLNIVLVGVYLLYANYMDCKHIPYRFMRFLAHRTDITDKWAKEGRPAVPLVVRRDANPREMVKLLMRGRHHLFYVVGESRIPLYVVPERRVVDYCLKIPRFHVK